MLFSSRNDFIDAHVHLWTNDFSRYPLAPGFKQSDLAVPSFTAKDILAEAQRNEVGRIVLVQMSYYGFDNRMMLDAIARAPDIFRGIAVIDHDQSHPEAAMRELARSGVRGFRIVALAGSANPLGRPGLDKMFACGARDSLALCFLTSPEMLSGIDRLCADFPDTPVVVDHMARIGMDGQIRARDVDALCRLARHRKTMVKVSAFYALGRKRPPHDDLAPLIRSLHRAFGASRLMWASDSPFQLMDETYRDSIALVRDRLSFLTHEDKEHMLRGTAERLFFR
jgi:predicted TIM-barrel fold metal-dependent hydrolase